MATFAVFFMAGMACKATRFAPNDRGAKRRAFSATSNALLKASAYAGR